eukprot:75290-Hanusia_phi.AAC.1
MLISLSWAQPNFEHSRVSSCSLFVAPMFEGQACDVLRFKQACRVIPLACTFSSLRVRRVEMDRTGCNKLVRIQAVALSCG